MPRKKSPTLTEAELRLMEILWKRGEATVADVVAAIPKREALHYSSVLTTMRILEQKGYVDHRQEGRAFVYHAIVDRSSARRSAVKHLLSRFFDDSPEALVLNVIDEERIDIAELERLRAVVEGPEGGPAERPKKGGRRG